MFEFEWQLASKDLNQPISVTYQNGQRIVTRKVFSQQNHARGDALQKITALSILGKTINTANVITAQTMFALTFKCFVRKV